MYIININNNFMFKIKREEKIQVILLTIIKFLKLKLPFKRLLPYSYIQKLNKNLAILLLYSKFYYKAEKNLKY